MNVGHLLDSTPHMRVELPKGMAYTKKGPTVVKTNAVRCLGGTIPAMKDAGDFSGHALTKGKQLTIKNLDMIPEPTGKISRFYTYGLVKLLDCMMRVPKILLDGGSVVTLMLLKLAVMFKLKLISNNDLIIRTATNETRPISHMVVMVLWVADVRTAVKIYLIDLVSTYSIPFGRCWLHLVKALGHYSRHAYTIHNNQEIGHPVPIDGNSKTFEVIPPILKI